jgi:pilus assembly protein FimV
MVDGTVFGGVDVKYRYRNTLLQMRKIAVVILVAAPLTAQALGLGRFSLSSGLDEPLSGQIEILSPTAGEIRTLKASLAAREDFEIAGVERAAHLFDIKYLVSQHANGQYFLKLTTDQPIREPFLHFLIQVEWSGGRLIREYSALLDPPQWAAGKPAEIETPQMIVGEGPSAAPTAAEAEAPAPVETLPPIGSEPQPPKTVVAETAPVESVPTPAAEPAPPTEPRTTAAAPTERPAEPAQMPVEYMPVTEPAAVPTPEPAVTAAGGVSEYGPVKSGETLSRIAERVNTDKTLTPQQVMVALLRANPAAFIDDNVNHLKAGKILSVPERETIVAIPRDQAAREFRAQYDAWQEYKLKLAGTSRALTVAEQEPAAPKKDEAKAEKPTKAEKVAQKPAGAKAEPADLLKIVRANLEQEVAEDTAKTPGVETRKDAAKEQSKLTERVATLEEAIESKQMQNKEMRERVGKLQDQVKNTERLIELENKDLALAQKQAAEKQAAAAAAQAAAEKAAADKAAQDKAAADKVAQDKAAAEAAAKTAAAAKPAEAQKPAPTAAKRPVAPPPPPPEEGFLEGLLASVMDNPVTLALLGGVAVLLVGMGGFYSYRRRRAAREFSESILSGSSSLSSEVSITDTSGQAAASDTSFLSDFSQGGMGNIHTDEVDPIAEAEVYLAYGRDEQAEEILKDAIVKDPARQELKGKLLEIYFQRHDVGAFETLAEELYAQLEGQGGKVWDKVEEMGRKLSPTNPMFRGGKPAAAGAAAGATTMLVSETAPATETADTTFETQGLDFATDTSMAAPTAQEMSLDFEPPPAPPAEPGAFDMTLDFDTGSTEPVAPEGGGFDFNLGLGERATEAGANTIDFDLPSTQESSGLDFGTSLEAQPESGLDFVPGGMADNTLEFEKTPATVTAEPETGLPGWDETATKLDLAKAYIDMGDSEGARSILDEVMAEGNDQQKQQARELASQIAA